MILAHFLFILFVELQIRKYIIPHIVMPFVETRPITSPQTNHGEAILP
jgi:hypothetical protein